MELFSEIAKLTGLPYEDCFAGFRYTVFSGKACYVVRHKGVRRYAKDEIVIALGSGMMTVHGAGLMLRDVTGGELMITGSIAHVGIEGMAGPRAAGDGAQKP
ncbi:MAG: YabP/YqfC family sporulation protein [Firmicutes bacterium]|nr:YabP/YqfC family sporulation protein [Bacillota bacterium]